MAQKNIAGKTIEVTDDGYLVNPADWDKDVAVEIAKEESLELTDTHFELINFLRDKIMNGQTLTIRAVGKSGIVDIKGFYQLFPGAPLKKATKVAGLSKPSSCV